MKITGKCKKDFEKWFKIRFNFLPNKEIIPFLKCFYDLDNSYKYGVLVDFFMSKGFWFEITHFYCKVWEGSLNHLLTEDIIDLHDARNQAITKANEIHNKNAKNKKKSGRAS